MEHTNHKGIRKIKYMLREYNARPLTATRRKPVEGDIVMDLSGEKYQVKAVGSKYCIAKKLSDNAEVHIKLDQVIFE